MADQIVSKDAWLLQGIGTTGKYGNGQGDFCHVGRVPSGTSDPDWKSRSVFEIQLRNGSTGILDGLGSVSAADFELTVAPNTCISGGRGSNFYAFLEEISGDFTEYNAGGNCSFSGAGPNTGEWNADSGATTTNRVFKSSSSLTTGDKVSFNNTAMVQAWLADDSKTEARVRVIFANSGGTAYDESAGAARATGFYTLQHATSGNRPVLHVTGSGSAVAKSDPDEVLAFTEEEALTILGTTPTDSDNLAFTETQTAGPITAWEVIADGTDLGRGKVTIPSSTSPRSSALLDDVAVEDVVMKCKFKINKIPAQQWVAWWLMARAQDTLTYYTAYVLLTTDNTITLGLSKFVNSTTGESLGSTDEVRALIVNTDYWIKFYVVGNTPTVLAAKVWRDGESEPSGWQLTNQDSEATLQTTGTVGLQISTSTVSNLPIAITFDNFEVTEP